MPLDTMASAISRISLSLMPVAEFVPTVPTHRRRLGKAVIGHRLEFRKSYRRRRSGHRVPGDPLRDDLAGDAAPGGHCDVKLVALQSGRELGAALFVLAGDEVELVSVDAALDDRAFAVRHHHPAGHFVAFRFQDELVFAAAAVFADEIAHPAAGEIRRRGNRAGGQE